VYGEFIPMRGRKGVSPIVGELLLVVAVVIFGTLAFVWASNVLFAGFYGFEFIYQREIERAKESFPIEFVHFINATILDVYVRNNGEIEVRLIRAYVFSVEGGPVANIPLDVTFLVGELRPVRINLAGTGLTIQSGMAYRIILVSENAVRRMATAEAP